MNIFSKFLKKDIKIKAITKGTAIEIEKVEDPVFSEKMMGDGIAFVLKHDTIYAPCNGKIIFIADTLHAIGIQLDSGVELMIHIGLDTVNLKGNGFTKIVSNKQIKQGDPLIKIDLNLMQEKQVNLTTMLIVTNSDKCRISEKIYGDVDLSDYVMSISKR